MTVMAATFLCLAACGCDGGWGLNGGNATVETAIPEPISLMLPEEIRLHSFTRTRVFDDAGGIRGVDVRVEAVDAYGDATKAFGTFRFEMYRFQHAQPDPKGQQIAAWTEELLNPERNLLHWEKVHRMYRFKLQWDQPIPVGQRYVLVAYFDSPYTQRLSDERVFISGQYE
jgi:hypothetical protein